MSTKSFRQQWLFTRTSYYLKQTGLSFIEMMMTIIISMLLISYLSGMYLSAEKNSTMQIALNTIKENSQISSQIFRKVISQAGHIGCTRFTKNFHINNHTDLSFTSTDKMTYYINDNQSSGLTIKNLSIENNVVLKDMRSDSIIYSSSEMSVKTGEVLAISNCKVIDMFIVKDISQLDDGTQKITTNEPLSQRYKKGSEIRKFESYSYYIADTGRSDSHNTSINALYVIDENQSKNELLEGIQHMQVDIDDKKGGVKIVLTFKTYDLEKNWIIYAVSRN